MKRLAETDQLETRLDSLGNSIRKQYLLEGFMRLSGFVLFGLVILFVLDYFTHLPFPVRLILLLAGIVYGFIWFRKNFFKKYQKKLTTEEVGLIVEKTNPSLQSRMISTLQFQANNEIKNGTSENLVEGMVNQTFEMIRDLPWANAIDKSWVKSTMKMFSIAAVLFVLACGLSSTSFLIFFHRFVSTEATYPTKTKIKDVSFENVNKGDTLRIPEGEKIIVKVLAEGELPPVGKISMHADSGSEADYDLKYDEVKKVFFGEMDPLLENVQVTILLGDDTWGPKSILVIPRPKIVSLTATITPPKYTKLDITKEQTGNLQVFEGSTIDFIIKSSKELISFDFMDFSKPEAKKAFVSKDGLNWTGQLKLTANTKYTFQMVDKEKLNSKDVPIYTISLINDKAPNIKILKPALNIEASPVSKIPVKIQIIDDFMVFGFRIWAQTVERNEIGEEIPKGKPKNIFEKSNINRKLHDYTGVWDLSNIKDVKLVPGNHVKIWIESWDNHEPEALTMKSQEVSVMIISAEELRLKLMTRTGVIGTDLGSMIIEFEGSNREIEELNK